MRLGAMGGARLSQAHSHNGFLILFAPSFMRLESCFHGDIRHHITVDAYEVSGDELFLI